MCVPSFLSTVDWRWKKYIIWPLPVVSSRILCQTLYDLSLPRYAPFHDSYQKTLAFRHRNETLGNVIKPRSILKHLCMWLVEVVIANKLSISKKIMFQVLDSMIKAKLLFFWTSNSEGHGSHGNKDTILFLGSVNVSMSVMSTELFVEISWVYQKL